ncbi:MAG: VOC family protein [Flavobacteriaceae bacterium]|nr:VOC family protein [Bacteroidia bacterium]MBT8286433.1 VOC family protein [Bacteroidia bacterium]NNF75709.1 VOC family protein [Flavobacteriaceae bacterium]NNK73701.1 VOC family protein [Flavobacteriaceae bacterium]
MNLNQVTISSSDVQRSVSFYQDLGLRLIVDARPQYARLECPDGESTFSIHLDDTLKNPIGITIYFEDDALDELVSRLQKKGIIFIHEPEMKRWLWREAHLKDPDGHLIILYKAGKNRKNPPWKIK